MSKWLNRLQPCGALLLRLVLGATMIHYGYLKVIPHGALNHFARYVATLGIPSWLGYISAFTEFVGGMLLTVGLFTRLAAFLVAVNLLVALFAVGIRQAFPTYSNIAALIAIAVMLLFYGAGTLALDRRIGFA